MTLGITIISSEAIYQSGDQILINTRTGQRLTDPSGKNVTLQFWDWTGYITYAGVGRVRGTDTSAAVKGWFIGETGLTFDEAVERLRTKGTEWLRGVQPGSPHTFVLASFVANVPTCAVISNFQQWHGARLATVADELRTSTVRARKAPQVIVIGQDQAVRRADRDRLRRLASDQADDPRRIRMALEAESRRAAQREPKLISKECLIFSLDRYGRGQMYPSGDLVADPEVLMNGWDVGGELRRLGVSGGQLRGMGSASSGFDAPPMRECHLELIDTSSPFELVLLETAPGIGAQPLAVNESGVAAGRVSPEGSSQPCIWPDPANLVLLHSLGGLGAAVHDINATGTCVGYSETDMTPSPGQSRISHACLWTASMELIDLGTGLIRDSGARRVDSDGRIAGYVSVDPIRGGQLHYRPATWSPGEPPQVIDDLGGDAWGEAWGFGPLGQVLIWKHGEGMFGASGATILDEAGLHDVERPGRDPNGFVPIGLLADGGLVAMTLGANRRGMLMTAQGEWRDLPLPSGSEITRCSSSGRLVGYVPRDGYRLGWIWAIDGNEPPTILPSWRFHDTHPSGVAASGYVVGHASADRCSHPLLWRPTPTTA